MCFAPHSFVVYWLSVSVVHVKGGPTPTDTPHHATSLYVYAFHHFTTVIPFKTRAWISLCKTQIDIAGLHTILNEFHLLVTTNGVLHNLSLFFFNQSSTVIAFASKCIIQMFEGVTFLLVNSLHINLCDTGNVVFQAVSACGLMGHCAQQSYCSAFWAFLNLLMLSWATISASSAAKRDVHQPCQIQHLGHVRLEHNTSTTCGQLSFCLPVAYMQFPNIIVTLATISFPKSTTLVIL